jgi:hypothetical protein
MAGRRAGVAHLRGSGFLIQAFLFGESPSPVTLRVPTSPYGRGDGDFAP